MDDCLQDLRLVKKTPNMNHIMKIMMWELKKEAIPLHINILDNSMSLSS